jgi:hypothetical protein
VSSQKDSQGDSQAVRNAHVESKNFNILSTIYGGPHVMSTEFQFSRGRNTTKSVSYITYTLFGPAFEKLEFDVSLTLRKLLPEEVIAPTRYYQSRLNSGVGRIVFGFLSELKQSASNCSFCQFLRLLFDPADIPSLRRNPNFLLIRLSPTIFIDRPFGNVYGVAPLWNFKNLRCLQFELRNDEKLNSDAFIFFSQSGMSVFALFIYTADVSICQLSY